MNEQEIIDLLSRYGYWMLLPVMIVEGPVATMVGAMLASFSILNPWLVLLLSIAADIVGDVFLYVIGSWYGLGFVRTIGKYIGITEELVERMKTYFIQHGGKTIFAAKSTIGLCWAAFTAAGIVKMEFKKFLWYSFLGGIVWSSFLVALGYFYGYLWREIVEYIQWIGWVIGSMAVFTFVIITLFKRRQSREFLR